MWFRPAGDHPRVCGEHIYVTNPDLLDSGSSPRMRGTPPAERVVAARSGIIPAYAGNTPRSAYSTAHGWDHPRVCGEHTMRNFPYLRDEGSSPRMRGTLGLIHGSIGNAGIIPAYAGNTSPEALPEGLKAYHPRVCGEHMLNIDMMVINSGSSPRMRGTLVSSWFLLAFLGIIPAYAGNTWCAV